MLAPQADEFPVKLVKDPVFALLAQLAIEPGALKGFFSLGVGGLAFPDEAGEFGLAAMAHRFDQILVPMADEILKRRGFAVFLPHEQQRDIGRQEGGCRGQFQALEGDQGAEALAVEAVAHLVVVLVEDQKAGGADIPGGGTPAVLAVAGIFAGVDEAVGIGLGQVGDVAVILIVAVGFAGEQAVQGMVKIVIPVHVQLKAALLAAADEAGVVEVGLRHEVDPPVQVFGPGVHGPGQFGEKRLGRLVRDAVHGIQAQGVKMVVGDPVQGVFDEETPHLIAGGAVEVDGFAPGGLAAAGEVGAEVPQVIALGAQVVVNHVQDGGQALFVAGVYQAFEAQGAAVALLHGKGVGAVVAPVAAAGELGHRHDLHRGDAQLLEFGQMGNNRVKGAVRGEGAHVEFIDDEILERQAEPALIFPGEGGVHHPGGTVHILGLVPGSGIGTLQVCMEAVKVETGGRHAVHHGLVVATSGRGQLNEPIVRTYQMHCNLIRKRGPHQKPAAFLPQVGGPQINGSRHISLSPQNLP